MVKNVRPRVRVCVPFVNKSKRIVQFCDIHINWKGKPLTNIPLCAIMNAQNTVHKYLSYSILAIDGFWGGVLFYKKHDIKKKGNPEDGICRKGTTLWEEKHVT